MGTAIALGNIVGITENIFLERVIPLQRHLNPNAVIRVQLEVKGLVHHGFIQVQVIHECFQPTVVLIDFLFTTALILEDDAHARVEESQFSQALGQLLEVELDIGKGGRRWFETYRGAR